MYKATVFYLMMHITLMMHYATGYNLNLIFMKQWTVKILMTVL